MNMQISKEWCEKMARLEVGDPTTGPTLDFRIGRSVLADGIVQIVRQGNGMDAGGVIAEVRGDECDAEAVADRIVALWNAT